MIIQVFVNLIDNAVKYSPQERAIDIGTAEAGPVVRVTVRDRGIGLDEQDAEKIFDEFYRANREEVRNTKGTGLGLAIVRKIVKEHKGRVYAEPADPGLKIIVELPKGEAENRKDRTTKITKITRLDSPSSARRAKESQRGI
jgi:signal transduction histidine kinase